MLIDKDLRLSISGCFWLFYASKYKKKIALFERKPCNLTKLLDNLKILLIKESRKRQNEK